MQIPILIGVDGEARAIVEKYNAGLFYEPENMNDFIEKTKQIFSDSNKLKEIKLGASKLANDFDRKILAKKMLQIIEDTITNTRNRLK